MAEKEIDCKESKCRKAKEGVAEQKKEEENKKKKNAIFSQT